MHSVTYFLYVGIVGLIRICKFIEYRILLLFTPVLKTKATELLREIGIVLHFPDEDKSQLQDMFNDNLQENKKLSAESDTKYEDRTLHIKVTDDKFFARCVNLCTLGGGESFMDGSWDYFRNVEDVTEFGRRVLENNLLDLYYKNPWNRFLEWLELYAFNLQTRKRAFQVGLVHYDLGNDLYELMLDPWMQYTCAYWKDAKNLSEAQINKMELIAQKLELKPGMRVLDIGCGWGSLMKYLSKNYQVQCVGVTISEEGAAYARNLCKGLPVDVRIQDYRDLDEKFDRILSIGMFEAVGQWNSREYFEVAERCLKKKGLFLLHTIGRNHYNYPSRSDPFSDKYIFPNGQVPSPGDIAESTKNLFVIEDWHNFGQDYAKTLFCWRENFMREWPKIRGNYGENFYRMWICYLSFARSLFLSRRLQLWQIMLSKDGLKRDYRAIR